MTVGPRFLWVRSENWEWFPNLSHCRSEMEISPSIYVRWETWPALQAPPTPSHVHGERRLEAHSRQLCGPREKRLGLVGAGGQGRHKIWSFSIPISCLDFWQLIVQPSSLSPRSLKSYFVHSFNKYWLGTTMCQALFWARGLKGAKFLLLTCFSHVYRPPGSKIWLSCS